MTKGDKSENQAKDRACCQPLALVLGTAGPSLRARRGRHLIEENPSHMLTGRWGHKIAGTQRRSEHTHLPVLSHTCAQSLMYLHLHACTPLPMFTRAHLTRVHALPCLAVLSRGAVHITRYKEVPDLHVTLGPGQSQHGEGTWPHEHKSSVYVWTPPGPSRLRGHNASQD